MKSLLAVTLVLVTAGAGAQSPRPSYPSCDLTAQHALKGEAGGRIKDAGRAHISMRANILVADVGSARKARRLTQARADAMSARIDKVRKDTDGFVAKQGFLSAAERASYDRELDAVATGICRS